MRTVRNMLMTSLMWMSMLGAAPSNNLPSQMRVANDHGGHIIVSCHAANGDVGTWIAQPPGVALRDGYILRPVDSNDMPGDEVYLACDDGAAQNGYVSTEDTPMPPQFIVKKNDEVDVGKFMVVDVESAPTADSTQSMFFVLKTYDGDTLVTTADATIVVDGASGNAQVFRAPLVTRISVTNVGFGVRHGAALAASATCELTYYDRQFEKKTILANTNCADLGKVVGWRAVGDQNLPATYLTAAPNPQIEHRR